MSIYRLKRRIDVLMVLCYILGRDRRSCRILSAFGRSVVELLSYDKQPSRKLFPVSCVVTDQKCLITLKDDKTGDVHYHLLYVQELGCPRQARLG